MNLPRHFPISTEPLQESGTDYAVLPPVGGMDRIILGCIPAEPFRPANCFFALGRRSQQLSLGFGQWTKSSIRECLKGIPSNPIRHRARSPSRQPKVYFRLLFFCTPGPVDLWMSSRQCTENGISRGPEMAYAPRLRLRGDRHAHATTRPSQPLA